jgi:quercetin dioxygenase-like cupin family protein
MEKAVSTVHVDNDHVRVTEWRFAPGAATGWHRHEFDYVITPVVGGHVEIVHGDGSRTPFVMESGTSYFREAGVEHDVVNGPGGELRFVEVELKSRPG